MIKIKIGTVGYWDGRKIVPLSAASDEIELDPKAEARFVEKGVAEYVGASKSAAEENKDEQSSGENPTYSEDMKVEELRRLGKKHGLTFKIGMSKVEMVAELDKLFNPDGKIEEVEDDSEAAPTFDSTEAVR